MIKTTVIYPGTFDPVTLGHIDLIQRVSGFFDKVIVGVAASTRKSPLFTLDQRIYLIKKAVEHECDVEVLGFEGLLVDFACRMEASVIVRGLRAVSDFEFEFQLSGMNRRLAPHIDTIFMAPGEPYAFLSATMVREIAELGGDVSAFVPPVVEKALYERFKRVPRNGVNDY